MTAAMTDAALDARTPRHDLAAEQSVLGALMLSPEVLEDVSALVQPPHFYRPAHQMIYEAILALWRRDEPTDAVTVVAELARAQTLTRVGGAPYIHTLISTVPAAANGSYYAKIVWEHARMRAMVATATNLWQMGMEGDPGRAEEYIARAHELLLDHGAGQQDDPPVFGTALMDVLDRIERGEDTTGRIPAPYVDLEALLGGLRPGQLITIGARPGVGKSVLATDLARHAAIRLGVPAFVASVEMPRAEIIQRIISAETGVMLTKLRAGQDQVSASEWDRVAARVPAITDAPLIIDDSPSVTLDSLRASLRRMARRADVDGAPGLLVVDYLQLLTSTSKAENRQVEVSELSRGLKLIAREYEIPVVMLAQLNRGSEARADKIPAVSDLRESGAVEQDSDVVILIHREDVYDKESPRSGEADLIVGKNRNGPTGTATVVFQGHYSRFVDMARMR